MKQYKVRVRIKVSKTSSSTIETTVTANSSSDAQNLVKGQYGSNLEYIYAVTEVR
jgi:hypothetical protein